MLRAIRLVWCMLVRCFSMRRAIANTVLLVTLGIFFAPALTAVAAPPLPMCCRRGGMHHCAMMAEMMRREEGTSLRTNNPCPMRQAFQIGTSVIALPVTRCAHFESNRELLSASAALRVRFAPVPEDHQRAPPANLL